MLRGVRAISPAAFLTHLHFSQPRSPAAAEGPRAVPSNASARGSGDGDERDAVPGGPRPLPSNVNATRVFVWGHFHAIPACKATGDVELDAAVRSPTEIRWFSQEAQRRNCCWEQIAFGPSFGVARTDTGELVIWGSGVKRQDGERHFMEPQALAFADDAFMRFVDVQASETAVWALSTEGDVILWEKVAASVKDYVNSPARSRPSPPGGRRLPGLEAKVRQMSIGERHAALLTQDGQLHTLGSNTSGQCAVNPQEQSACAVDKVRFPRHVLPVTQAGAGQNHTVVLTGAGLSFAWGDDSKIQLGLGDTRSNLGDERPFSGARGFAASQKGESAMAPASVTRGASDSAMLGKAFRSTSSARYGEFAAHLQYKPMLMQDVPLEFERQVHGTPYPPADMVRCGSEFTIVACRDSPDWYPPQESTNRLFCCGENGRGQCGRSMQAGQQTMAAVRLPRHTWTRDFACGASHCLAVVQRLKSPEAPEIWSWGGNESGQTTGTTRSVCPPVKVRLPGDSRVEAACASFSTSAALCSTLPPELQRKSSKRRARADDGE